MITKRSFVGGAAWASSLAAALLLAGCAARTEPPAVGGAPVAAAKAPAAPPAGTVLEYKMPEGRILSYQSSGEGVESTEAMGHSMESRTSSRDAFSLRAKGRKEGNLLMGVTIEGESSPTPAHDIRTFDEGFCAGTTSVQAADEQGWVVSVTPSGGWVPAVIAGKTGVGLSQRAQSFGLDPAENPFNVIEPGKRPRVTLTPTLALKDGRPYLSFAVQGGDTQDQNLLQFFLNVVEFGMNVQQSVEAANLTSYQMRSSFGNHESQPGRVTLRDDMPGWIRDELRKMGYTLDFARSTSGPINAIFFDWKHGTFWGGSSDNGDDYGIAW